MTFLMTCSCSLSCPLALLRAHNDWPRNCSATTEKRDNVASSHSPLPPRRYYHIVAVRTLRSILSNFPGPRHSVQGWVSPLKKMTECSQRPNTVADDLSGCQHGHRQDCAGNTPHPEPEDERNDDEDGIEGEPSGQKHRR